MGAQGTATLDFGAFPGSNVAYVDVVATGVISTSAIEAWLRPVATADHTDTDHIAAPMKVSAVFVSNDNIRIYGINQNDVMPPLEPQLGMSPSDQKYARMDRQNSPMFVGQFSVWWVWN
jgi:hypothetical protein